MELRALALLGAAGQMVHDLAFPAADERAVEIARPAAVLRRAAGAERSKEAFLPRRPVGCAHQQSSEKQAGRRTPPPAA